MPSGKNSTSFELQHDEVEDSDAADKNALADVLKDRNQLKNFFRVRRLGSRVIA
jgi:mRNA-degrading endonuclease RelE of RelBE toxin-antitoxin system